MTPKHWSMILGAAVLATALTGCGYQLANRSSGALPQGTRVVAVLPFANHTDEPQLPQQISAAVATQLEERRHYRIQARVQGSDVAIHGDVLSVQVTPVTFDASSGRATTAAVVLHLRAWVTAEPSGKVLFRNNDMVFHGQYEISTELQNFVEEDSSAMQRMSQTIGQTLVSDILEAF